jgi:hypothetical protein
VSRLMPLLLALALLGVVAAPASAGPRDKIIEDCADDGVLQGNYSPSELRDARKNLPSDVAEYTDCADVLRRAELPDGGGAGGGTGSGGGGSGVGAASGASRGPLLTPANDAERRQLQNAAARAGTVDLAGDRITPGASGLSPDAARNGIPGTLIAVLVGLLLLGLALIGPAIRRFDWTSLGLRRRRSA